MLDALVQFLLEELAMYGEQGADPASLIALTKSYFGASTSPAQIVDDPFLSFLWSALITEDDLHPGVLVAPPVVPKPTPAEDEPEDQDVVKLKGKKKAKGKPKDKPRATLRPLTAEEEEQGWSALIERFGERLRIAVSEDQCYVALTGSHSKLNSVTPQVYEILQFVGRSRTEGVVMTEISKDLQYDPKSCFHYVRTLVEIGAVKKFRAAVHGAWTNRILHVRYLDRSEHWAVHNARDNDASASDEGEHADAEPVRMSPLSRTHLQTNRRLVCHRILAAIKRNGGELPHTDISSCINLLGRDKNDVRLLNSIVALLVDEGKIEKVSRTNTGRGTTTVYARLVHQGEPSNAEQSMSEPAYEDEADLDGPYALSGVSLERQTLDLLIEADAAGLRNYDISKALSNYPYRFVDQMLSRIQRPAPPHLGDHALQAHFENAGREKRTRWFTETGYLHRVAEEDPSQLPDEFPSDDGWGGWVDETAKAYDEEQDFVDYRTGATLSKGAGKQAAAKRDQAKKEGKARKSAHTSEAGQKPKRAPKDPSEGPKKPTGRPRKTPLPPGKETYYQRRKREDAERAAQGLPPKERKPGGNGKGKWKKGVGEEGSPAVKAEEQEQDEIEDEVDQLESPAVADTPASSEASQQATPSAKSALDVPAPVPKKRGRPPKAASALPPAKKAKVAPAPSTSSSTVPGAKLNNASTPPDTPAAVEIASESAPASKAKKARFSDIIDGASMTQPSKAAGWAAPPPRTTALSSSPVESLKQKKSSFIVGPFSSKPKPKSTSSRASPATDNAEEEGDETPIAGPSNSKKQLVQAERVATPPSDSEAMNVESPAPASPPKKAPRAKRSANKGVPKRNLTAVQREKDLLAFIEHAGGITEFGARDKMTERIKAFLLERNPEAPAFLMDRGVLKKTIEDLVKAGALSLTTVQVGDAAHLRRHDLIYLASIALDSPEMTAYQLNLHSDANQTARKMWGTSKLEGQDDTLPAEDELPGASREVLRDFFHHHQQIMGASNGAFYGRFPRARALHVALVDLLTSSESPADAYIVDENVFTTRVFIECLTLRTFLRIIPVASVNTEFKKFVADEANLDLRLSQLPRWVQDEAAPHTANTRRNLSSVTGTLESLGLIEPLVVATAMPGVDTKMYSRPPSHVGATHFRLSSTAPIYAFRTAPYELFGVSSFDTVEEANAFWAALKSAAFPSEEPVEMSGGIDDHSYSTTYDGPKALATAIRSTTKWREEYMLLQPQRNFLSNLRLPPDAITPDKLAELAEDLLAPVSTIEHYLAEIEKPTAKKTNKSTGQKRRKFQREISQDQTHEEEKGQSGSDTEPAAPKHLSAKAMGDSLRGKAKEATTQREQVFMALLDRFSQERDNVELSGPIFDYLKKRFTSSTPGRLDAKALEKEFRLLLPGALHYLEDEIAYISVVPLAIRRKAEEINDPYALPQAPRIIRRRPNKPKPPRAVTPPVAQTGAASEFYTATPRAVPVLEKGQRLPRGFFTPEQDELCLDAVAVLKARVERLGARISWAGLAPLFEGIPPNKLRQWFSRITAAPEDAFYHQRLQAAWAQVWEAKHDSPELPDPQPTSVTTFDITACVRCLRANVDKQTLRLMGGPPPAAKTAAAQAALNGAPKSATGPLPASIVKLEEEYRVETAGGVDSSNRWAWYWKTTTAHAAREADFGWMPASSLCYQSKTVPPTMDRATALIMSTIKSLVVTPETSYSEPDATELLRPMEAQLAPALNVLLENNVVQKVLSEERRAPGRNFVANDRFLASFDDVLTARRARDAIKFEHDSLEEDHDEQSWPLSVEIGDMMALIELVSEDKVAMSVDTSFSTEFRDPEDYQTRKADDECIENMVNYRRVGDLEQSPAVIPVSAPVDDSTSDPELLSSSLASLDGAQEVLSDIMQHLQEVGEGGVAMGKLQAVLDLPRTELLGHLHTLTGASPPLAFWAGEISPVVVASRHLGSWTIQVSRARSKAPQHLFPVIWRDLQGDVIRELWLKVVGWTKSLLFSHPGSTCIDLVYRAKSMHGGLFLSTLEVMLVLSSLEAVDAVERRSDLSVGIDWEQDRFFLGKRWYQLS